MTDKVKYGFPLRSFLNLLDLFMTINFFFFTIYNFTLLPPMYTHPVLIYFEYALLPVLVLVNGRSNHYCKKRKGKKQLFN